MADRTVNSTQVQFDLTLQNSAGTVKTRRISFDSNYPANVTLGENARTIGGMFKNGPYDWVFQPTDWRDSDDAEEAYQVVNVEVQLIDKTTTTLEVI